MPTAWDAAIKKTKQLKIFAGEGATSGRWSTLLDRAIAEFGKLSHASHLGVKFVRSTQPPDEQGPGGAQVRFEVRQKGSISYTVLGDTVTMEVGEGIDGANTQCVAYSLGSEETYMKAFIALPITFLIATPSATREIGDNARVVSIVHEMIHACGLIKHNSDESKPDVFSRTLRPVFGDTPAGDKLGVGDLRMPPIVLATQTAARIQELWS
jgi:hypothetical protein